MSRGSKCNMHMVSDRYGRRVGMVPACRVLIDLDEVGPSEGRSLLGAILLAVTGRIEIMDDG